MRDLAGHPLRRDIEGLRALAVVLVLLFHAGVPGFSGGFVGVDVFFVLSGYLITRSLVMEAERTGGIRFGEFFARRLRRLLPAAALVLAVTAAAVRFVLPETMWRDFASDIIGAALYVSNWLFLTRSVDYLAEDVLPSPVLHFWSLSIEEQFYVIWPLIIAVAAVVAARRRWNVRRVALSLLLVLIVLPSFAYANHRLGVSPAAAFFDTGARLWELGLGAIAALLPQPGWAARMKPAMVAGLRAACVVVLLGAVVLVAPTALWPGPAALLIVLPTSFLVWSGGSPESRLDAVLGWSPVQWVGARSYSIYLWHWPPIAIADAAAGGIEISTAILITVASILPAAWSYRYVEHPVRYSAGLRRSSGLSLSVGANLTGVGVAAGALLLLGSYAVSFDDLATASDRDHGGVDALDGSSVSPGFLEDDLDVEAQLVGVQRLVPSPVNATSDRPRTYDDGCQVVDGRSTPVVCEYGAPDGDVRIALVGDSKALQWSSALISLAENHRWSLTVITKSSCPLTTSVLSLGELPLTDCLEWADQTLDILDAGSFDVVLVSQGRNVAYVDRAAVDARELMVRGMTDAYGRIERAGAQVVILMDNHHPGSNVYECVSRHRHDMRPCVFDRDDSRGGRPAQRRAAEQGFSVIDTGQWLCPEHPCLPVVDGILLYRQGSHLTTTAVDALAPLLEARLRAVADVE